jgi:hypothetical protein
MEKSEDTSLSITDEDRELFMAARKRNVKKWGPLPQSTPKTTAPTSTKQSFASQITTSTSLSAETSGGAEVSNTIVIKACEEKCEEALASHKNNILLGEQMDAAKEEEATTQPAQSIMEMPLEPELLQQQQVTQPAVHPIEPAIKQVEPAFQPAAQLAFEPTVQPFVQPFVQFAQPAIQPEKGEECHLAVQHPLPSEPAIQPEKGKECHLAVQHPLPSEPMG